MKILILFIYLFYILFLLMKSKSCGVYVCLKMIYKDENILK